MNEKRYFKIFCNRHTDVADNKYFFLFTVISNMSDFDETVFQKNLENKDFSFKFISSDLKYLKKILLKSLNDFHIDKTVNLNIKQQLISIEILFYKGLYEECLLLISKAKTYNQELHNYHLHLELLIWEKKCIGYSVGLLNAIEINNKLDSLFDDLKQGKVITDFYYMSYYYKNSIGKIPKDEINEGFDKIFSHKIFKSEPELNFIQLKIYYYLIYANFYHVIDDDEYELIFLKKTLDVFDTNKIYRFENPLDYLSIYFRVIEIFKKTNSDLFYIELNLLRNFDTIIDIQKVVVIERIYLFALQAELEHLLINNKIESIEILLNNVIYNINNSKYKIEPYYDIKIYYLIASVLCTLNNFSEGLKFVNKVLNEYKFKDRPNIFVKTEFLNILIHYELKNFILVLYLIKNYTKKYSKFYVINYLEKKILKTIIKISNNPHISNEKRAFTKLKNKIDKKEIDLTTTVNINYYNYIVRKTK